VDTNVLIHIVYIYIYIEYVQMGALSGNAFCNILCNVFCTVLCNVLCNVMCCNMGDIVIVTRRIGEST
jgi:hypothetical protein